MTLREDSEAGEVWRSAVPVLSKARQLLARVLLPNENKLIFANSVSHVAVCFLAHRNLKPAGEPVERGDVSVGLS